MLKVLISDKLSPAAVRVLEERGIHVDLQPDLGKDPARLAGVIEDYDGLAIRSATRVTPELLERATKLKVIGRAGIGTDNIDKAEASRRGIIVMNTPFGNMTTTAEHAIAMMFAVARQIPEASASTHEGKWEKSRFMGTELTGKTLGVIGAGNIGGIVCDRARGLKMKVLAHDPYLSSEKAERMGVTKVELDELLARADFVTLHVPLTDSTRGILSREALRKTKPGVRIVNCARGGLVDEEALAELLKSGHIAGAAFDVFAEEPATENPLFGLPNVVCTPHLGAATNEAQENVAVQVAEQTAAYLVDGAVENALNMPSLAAEEARVMAPWVALAGHLGSFAGQVANGPIERVEVTFDGAAGDMNLKALECAAVAGIMERVNPDVNMVSAPMMARERGVKISTTKQGRSRVYDGFLELTVRSGNEVRSVAGTVFADGKPRFIELLGIHVDAEVGEHMLCTTNEDLPGIIGELGRTLADAGVNIANFTLGRSTAGADAIGLVHVDGAIPYSVVANLRGSGRFREVKPLHFGVE